VHPSGYQITQLLQAWSEGDQGALEQLMPVVYDDLHRLTQRYMAQERPGHTLQATALVHEAYLRLLDSAHPTWQNKAHFFAVCARMMRRILVDWARSHQTLKRGSDGPPLHLDLEEPLAVVERPGRDLVAVDDALTALAALDPRKSQIVELRFFGGLSAKESAEVLKVSEETALRDWKLAKSWLRRELNRELNREQSRGA
jgi:RNA polymerase sigma factor (TIGR02999 family)